MEWKETTIAEECDVNPNTGKLEEYFMYIDLESVVKGRLEKLQKINKADAPSRAQRVLSENDILFQCVRPYQINNYIFKEFNDKSQWVASTGYAQLKTKNNNPEYIYHLLNTPNFNRKVMVRCTGSSYPAINSEDLSKIHFYKSSSIIEQERIAHLLSLLDKRISTQNKIIEKLQSLIKGLSQSLLSTKQGWVAYRLDDLVQIKSGYSRTQVCFKTPYLVSRIETISKHCIDMSRVGYVQNIPKSYKLNIGDILFSNINSVQYIGNTAYLDKEYGLYHGMNLLRLIPNSTLIIPRFLHLLLCTDKIINYFQTICNKAVSQASINQSALGKTVLFIPSIAVQQHVCDTFESVENKLKLEFTLYKNLLLQKQYFLQQMFI